MKPVSRAKRGSVSVRAADLTGRLTPAKACVRFDALRSAKRALDDGRGAHGRPVDRAVVVLAVVIVYGPSVQAVVGAAVCTALIYVLARALVRSR